MGLPRNTAARFVGAHIGLAGPQAGLPPPTRPLLRRPAADEAPTTEGDQMHGGSASSGARGTSGGIAAVETIPRKCFWGTRITHPVLLQTKLVSDCHHGLGCSYKNQSANEILPSIEHAN
uniref:Uncharacterized protein n=1 Tax=Oryza meridionalis TaxID=40149 RepID=A0A0E0EMW8_9ORYZ